MKDVAPRLFCALALVSGALVSVAVSPPLLAMLASEDGRIDSPRARQLLWTASAAAALVALAAGWLLTCDRMSVIRGFWRLAWRTRWFAAAAILIALGVVAWRYVRRDHVDLLARVAPSDALAATVAEARRAGQTDALKALADHFLAKKSRPFVTPWMVWITPRSDSERIADAVADGVIVRRWDMPPVRWNVGEPLDWSSRTPLFIVHDYQAQEFTAHLLATDPPDEKLRWALAFFDEWRRANPAAFNFNAFAWGDGPMSQRIQARLWLQDELRRRELSTREVELDFLRDVIRHADKLRVEAHHNYRTNHGMMQNCALLDIAVACPELDRESRWRETAIARMRRHLLETVTPEGVFREIAPRYHFHFATTMAVWFVALCQQAGIELAPLFEDRARKMVAFSRELLLPDRTLPRIADSDGHVPDASLWPWQELPDWEELRELRAALTNASAPPNAPGARLWDAPGYFILRAPSPDWTVREGLALTLRVGPRSLAHEHYDALAITLFARGRSLIDGPGYLDNNETGYRRLCLATPSQSTVSVDNQSQAPGGSIVRFCDIRPEPPTETGDRGSGGAPEFVALQGEARLYAGVTHRRTLFYGPNLGDALVIDELDSAAQHIYRQHFRAGDGLDVWSAPGTARLSTTCAAGMTSLLNMESWAIAGDDVFKPGGSATGPVVSFAASGQRVTFVTLLRTSVDTGSRVQVGAAQIEWLGSAGAARIGLPVDARSYRWSPAMLERADALRLDQRGRSEPRP